MELTPSVRTLELTVLSVEDLRVDRKPIATAATMKNLFVVVRAESINSYTTCMAKEGTTNNNNNNNPTWNHKLVVEVPVHARSITFEVKNKTLKGVKDVGVARVAISEFIGGVVGVVPQHNNNCLQFLSFRLRDWEGRRNGVLNFSVKVVNSPGYATATATAATTTTKKVVSPCGFQMMRGAMGASSSSSSSGGCGVVTGVPVWWNNYARSNV